MRVEDIKIYHIVHVDRLGSIVENGGLYADSEVRSHELAGTTIGMQKIKERRLLSPLASHPSLHVGECVPFYFCPRSVMLYMFERANSPDITYRGGQEPIIHLAASLNRVVAWADENRRRWAFTDSNAGSRYFNDYADVSDLDKIDWDAVRATQWSGRQDKKQAEFLLERFINCNIKCNSRHRDFFPLPKRK
ncbi:MAG: DUF4433 domain-containing protein [Clostridiales bacterium]|jgi:hypothetical protein|nr:DUF4433 domain-containing protein [Clostridiales bacterium]